MRHRPSFLLPVLVLLLAAGPAANLKLGRYDAAIAEYDAALALAPTLANSLFGRGVAKRAKDDNAAGDADLAAARTAKATTSTRRWPNTA